MNESDKLPRRIAPDTDEDVEDSPGTSQQEDAIAGTSQEQDEAPGTSYQLEPSEKNNPKPRKREQNKNHTSLPEEERETKKMKMYLTVSTDDVQIKEEPEDDVVIMGTSSSSASPSASNNRACNCINSKPVYFNLPNNDPSLISESATSPLDMRSQTTPPVSVNTFIQPSWVSQFQESSVVALPRPVGSPQTCYVNQLLEMYSISSPPVGPGSSAQSGQNGIVSEPLPALSPSGIRDILGGSPKRSSLLQAHDGNLHMYAVLNNGPTSRIPSVSPTLSSRPSSTSSTLGQLQRFIENASPSSNLSAPSPDALDRSLSPRTPTPGKSPSPAARRRSTSSTRSLHSPGTNVMNNINFGNNTSVHIWNVQNNMAVMSPPSPAVVVTPPSPTRQSDTEGLDVLPSAVSMVSERTEYNDSIHAGCLAKQPSQTSPSSNSAARAVPKPDLKLSSKEQSEITHSKPLTMDNSDKLPRRISPTGITPDTNQDVVERPGTCQQEDERPGTSQVHETPRTSYQLEPSDTEKAKENNPKPRKRKQKKKHTSLPDSGRKPNNEEQQVLEEEGEQPEVKKRKKEQEKSSDDPLDCCQQWCLRNVDPQVRETLHHEYREELNNGPTQGREYLCRYISHTEPKKQGQRRNFTFHYQVPRVDDGFMYICLRAFLQIFQITQNALREARRQLDNVEIKEDDVVIMGSSSSSSASPCASNNRACKCINSKPVYFSLPNSNTLHQFMRKMTNWSLYEIKEATLKALFQDGYDSITTLQSIAEEDLLSFDGIQRAQISVLRRFVQSLNCQQHPPIYPGAVQQDQGNTGSSTTSTGPATVSSVGTANAQLHDACRAGNVTEVKNCLKQGAEINSYDIKDLWKQTALHHASKSGHDNVCQVLLHAGADIHARDWQKRTALHLASRSGHDKICQVLLQAGADVQATDKTSLKQTALHYASSSGHDNVCQVLLQAGADVHATDESKQTALHLASGSGHDNICQVLLQAETAVHATNVWKLTALHYASKSGHDKVCQVLLQAGVDVDATDMEKRTALHHASKLGHDKVCQVLLQTGADAHATDMFGLKPIDVVGKDKRCPRQIRVRQALQAAMEKESAIINEKK